MSDLFSAEDFSVSFTPDYKKALIIPKVLSSLTDLKKASFQGRNSSKNRDFSLWNGETVKRVISLR